MKSELNHILHPRRILIFWISFYAVITIIGAFFFYQAADKIKLHTVPSGSVELSIPYSKYLVGEVVSFTLKNNYNSPIYVNNNCPNEPLAIYRLEGSEWTRIHDQTSIEKCPTQDRQVSVPANGVIGGSFEPWEHLFEKPGQYRVVAYVEYYNELPHQDFEVIAKPEIPAPTITQKPNATANAISTPPTVTSPVATPQAPQPSTPATSAPERKSQTVAVSGGSVSVQYDNTAIYVTSIAPATGCNYEGGRSGPEVEVEFKCNGTETQLKLTLSNGQLVQRVQSED